MTLFAFFCVAQSPTHPSTALGNCNIVGKPLGSAAPTFRFLVCLECLHHFVSLLSTDTVVSLLTLTTRRKRAFYLNDVGGVLQLSVYPLFSLGMFQVSLVVVISTTLAFLLVFGAVSSAAVEVVGDAIAPSISCHNLVPTISLHLW